MKAKSKPDDWIGYGTDNVIQKYGKEIDDCEDITQLREALLRWDYLAPDALKAAEAMDHEGFKGFYIGLKAERKKQFAGNAWEAKYGAILMPARMIRVGILAHQCHVPFGCAYIRMKEMGKLDG